MVKPGSAADFLARAAEARREAAKAKSEDIAQEFLKLADMWERLAAKVEKQSPENS